MVVRVLYVCPKTLSSAMVATVFLPLAILYSRPLPRFRCTSKLNDQNDLDGPNSLRKELALLQSLDARKTDLAASDSSLEGLGLEADIRRLSKKRDLEKLYVKERDVSTEKGVVSIYFEKFLVLDFFFILFALAWFLGGLGEKSFLDTSTLLDAWFPLWPLLFQPALGIFMASALFSAASGYLTRKSNAD